MTRSARSLYGLVAFRPQRLPRRHVAPSLKRFRQMAKVGHLQDYGIGGGRERYEWR
jgi:hypothetical protein